MDFAQACTILLAAISSLYAFQAYRRERSLARNLNRWKQAARFERERTEQLKLEVLQLENLIMNAKNDAHEAARDEAAYNQNIEFGPTRRT